MAVQENDSPNTIAFLMADIGEGIAEVELLQWFVQEGDVVSQFDKLCEVQSDKATVEITSRYDGKITRLHGQVGDMMQVGQPLLFIETSSQGAPTAPSEMSFSAPPPSPPPPAVLHDQDAKEQIPSSRNDFSPSNEKKKVLTTPAVRKLAKDHSLDITSLVGTGPHGRVLKADILKVLQEQGRIQEQEPPSAIESDDRRPMDPAATPIEILEKIPIRGYNRLMVKTMTEALTIPHMGFGDEINMTRLVKYKKSIAETHLGVSILAFVIKATSLALLDHPKVNSTLNLDEMVLEVHKQHHFGIAIDTPRGLAVPVVRSVQDKSLIEISQELNRLKQLAKDSQLNSEDLKDTTLTLSNVGALGHGTYMSPIITSPQVAVGAMGCLQRVPRFKGDSMEVEEAFVMNISWAGDHRALDGATLARFSHQCKHYLQEPTQMLLHMK